MPWIRHLISFNPTQTARIPRKKITVEEIENTNIVELFLERGELTEFLKETDTYGNFVYVVLIYVLTFSGMRPGEGVALYERNVIRGLNQIVVSKTMSRRERCKATCELTPPKTSISIYQVDMDAKIIDMLHGVLPLSRYPLFQT